jgi:hypothetical protein
MKSALLIARREAYAYLRSPLGAAVIAAVLLGEGLYFYWAGLTERRVSAEVLQEFFNIASSPRRCCRCASWPKSVRRAP